MRKRTIFLFAVTLFSMGAAVYQFRPAGMQFRGLASVPNAKSRVFKKVKEEILIDCNALGDESRLVADTSELVTLKIKKCAQPNHKKIINYKVSNLSNGYEGQVFKRKRADLATDYIQISPGENLLNFEISLNDGQKINKKIKINRSQTL